MENREEQLKYGIALGLANGVGNVHSKTLIGYCGSPKDVFHTKKTDLLKIPGVGEIAANGILKFNDFQRAEEEVEFIQKNNIEALFYFDKQYPVRLKACDDSPIVLFTHNHLPLHSSKVISIVGTRNASNYGKKIVRDLMEELAQYDCTVISGMAYGVDIEAHKACVANKVKTMAVVAHGLDNLYPSLHRPTLEKMRDMHCGLVSEFLTDTTPNRENFPKRNRIIAGLADATIVIESDIKGGSMITAELAHGYNRELFAVPGPVGAKYSSGCNSLIKRSKAYMLEGIADLIYHLGWEMPSEGKANRQKQLFIELTQEEKLVLDTMSEDEIAVDELYMQTQIPMSKLALILLDLEFNNLVLPLPGKRFRKA